MAINALPQALINGTSAPSWMSPGNYVQATGGASNDPNMTFGGDNLGSQLPINITQLDPQTLQALQNLGWSGGNPIISQQGGGSGQNGTPTASNALSPQFLQWAQQNGIFPNQSPTGNTDNLGFYNSSSTGPGNGQIGNNTGASFGQTPGFMAAAGGLLGGAGLLNAGLIGAASGAATGGGLSSSDLAALYGDAGYGGAAGTTPGVIGGSLGAANGALVDPAYASSLQGAASGATIPGSTGSLGTAFGDTSLASGNAAADDAALSGVGSNVGSGATAGLSGATNPALIESGLGTAGYGASSAGAGGGVGDLSGISGPSTGSGLGTTLSNLLTNPNGSLSGLASSLLGTGVGLATGSLGKGNTGLLNQVNYQNAATAAGQSARTNQTNSQGSLTYNQTGTDAQGNPTYTQSSQLNAPYQANLNSALANQGGAINNLAAYNQGLPAAYAAAPSIYGNAGSQQGLVQQAQNAAYNSQTQYLDPQYAQLQKQLNAQLANQGVTYGSDAYNAANTQFGSQQNQAYGTARDSAIAQGDAYANTLFNQNLQANQQYNTNLNNQGTNLLNQSSGALNGVVQNPTFATPPPATNYLGAAQLQGNANLNQYNAQTGNQNSLTSALTGLGGAILGNPNARQGLGNLVSGVGTGLSNLFGSGGG